MDLLAVLLRLPIHCLALLPLGAAHFCLPPGFPEDVHEFVVGLEGDAAVLHVLIEEFPDSFAIFIENMPLEPNRRVPEVLLQRQDLLTPRCHRSLLYHQSIFTNIDYLA